MTEQKDHVQLSQEEQQALMEKYDAESRTRKLSGIMAKIIVAILIAFSLFQIYTGAFGEYTAYIQRTVHLGFALVLIFLLFPARKKSPRKSIAWYDYALAVLSIIVCGYWPLFYESLVQKIGGISTTQMIIGGLATPRIGSSQAGRWLAASYHCYCIPFICLVWSPYAGYAGTSQFLVWNN